MTQLDYIILQVPNKELQKATWSPLEAFLDKSDETFPGISKEQTMKQEQTTKVDQEIQRRNSWHS